MSQKWVQFTKEQRITVSQGSILENVTLYQNVNFQVVQLVWVNSVSCELEQFQNRYNIGS